MVKEQGVGLSYVYQEIFFSGLDCLFESPRFEAQLGRRNPTTSLKKGDNNSTRLCTVRLVRNLLKKGQALYNDHNNVHLP